VDDNTRGECYNAKWTHPHVLRRQRGVQMAKQIERLEEERAQLDQRVRPRPLLLLGINNRAHRHAACSAACKPQARVVS
jgi:hypothetical protein